MFTLAEIERKLNYIKNMNYNWNLTTDKGQFATGFTQVYEAIVNGNRVITCINYQPIFDNENDRKVLTTILLEGNEKEWTKGIVKSIFHDMQLKIVNEEENKFNKGNKLEHMTIQVHYLEKLNNFESGISGDYSFN